MILQGRAKVGVQLFMWEVTESLINNNIRMNFVFCILTTITLVLPQPVLIDAEKTLDKIQHPFMIIVPNKLGMQQTYLNIIKDIDVKTIANITINIERLKAFPLI